MSSDERSKPLPIVAIVLVLTAAVFGLFLVERKKANSLGTVQADSILAASGYSRLLEENLDIRQELYAREWGAIPVVQEPPNISGKQLEFRPVTNADIPPSEQDLAKSALQALPSDSFSRRKLRVLYHQNDR